MVGHHTLNRAQQIECVAIKWASSVHVGAIVNITENEAAEMRQAVVDFKRAMELRSELNLRVARRVTSILRVGMFSFAVVTVILVVMLFAFTSSVGNMISVLDTMRVQFSSMSADMRQMRTVIAAMDRDLATFPVVVGELDSMRTTVAKMNANLATMSGSMTSVESKMRVITTDVANMNQSFRYLEPALVGIGANVNQASEPMKTFNNIFPW